MKKNSFLIAIMCLITVSQLCAQIPSNYYNSATSNGYTLKTELHQIINNHNDQGYNAIDTFFANYDLDQYYEPSSNTILDIYSENPNGSDPYNFTPINDECGQYSAEGDCYNKEHIIPQSVFNSNNPMRGDAHQLLPTDGRVNGFRASYPMGRVDDENLASNSGISNPTLNGSKLGANLNSGYSSGYTGIVFEPIDEFKGDIARIYFYFATRYQDQISAWSAYPMFDGSSDKVFENTFLNILLEWHEIDPVSTKEIERNDNIFYHHQNNRNPFVDHPEFVTIIWAPNSDTTAPSIPTNLTANSLSTNSIQLIWEASTDNVGVSSYSIFENENYINETTNTSFTVTGLNSNTNYCFTVRAQDVMGNNSENSNQACDTTFEDGSGNPTELFFSEYVEGSSNNKALEIVNITGNTINLSAYTIARDVNSNGAWGSSLQLVGNLQNNNVHVIARGNAAAGITAIANQLSSGDAMSFNGDDPIGLFKNGILIDIIGVFGGDNNYANRTLRRKQNISTPNTVFDYSGEWDSYASNTFDGLGSHNVNLSTSSVSEATIVLFPNPVKGNEIYVEYTGVAKFELYDIAGNKIQQAILENKMNKININNIKSGIYIAVIKNHNTLLTKKIIRL